MKRLSLFLFGAAFHVSLKAQLTATVLTSASCFSPCTGSATINVSGGMPPYTYSIFPATYTAQTMNTFYGLCPSNYTYVACDATFSCTSGTFNIGMISAPAITNVTYAPVPPPPPPPPFLYNATATISGGNAPYYVTWYQFNGINYVPVKNHTVNVTQDTAFLYPGDYSVTVTDANNVSAGCNGGTGYQFSICDNGVGSGQIIIQPNDTVCVNTTFTVSYVPILYAPVNIIAYGYNSSSSSCMPSNAMGPYETFTCSVSTPTTITFDGAWGYATGCFPILMPTATLVVDACLSVPVSGGKDVSMQIVPNPSDGVFRLMFNNNAGSVKVEVTDITGKVLYAGEHSEGEYIRVNLLPGMYYIRCHTNRGIVERKLLIMH
ncbi:MAG: hypothetical protein KatS3mg028_1050 [Bacteroidia bacterium]|nr:MAG: hypothetical protein KatS3mg028_1050 [Bacteroidia bacterium]